MKRVTSWPQAVLGLAFAWGALVGWAAMFGAARLAGRCCSMPPRSSGPWATTRSTPLQDTTDDAIVGIGSTALRFGDHVRRGVGVALCSGGRLRGGGRPGAPAAARCRCGWPRGFRGCISPGRSSAIAPDEPPARCSCSAPTAIAGPDPLCRPRGGRRLAELKAAILRRGGPEPRRTGDLTGCCRHPRRLAAGRPRLAALLPRPGR